MLYCLLTKVEVNNKKDDIEKHVEGKKFQKKLCILTYTLTLFIDEAWKQRMLKKKKKLQYILKLARKSKSKKDILYSKYLLKNKYAQLKRLSLLSILRIK